MSSTYFNLEDERVNNAINNAIASMRMEGFKVSDEDIENLINEVLKNNIVKVMVRKNNGTN